MARPRKNEQDKRKPYNVPLSETEKDKLTEQALASSMRLAPWIRWVLFKEIPNKRTPNPNRKAVIEAISNLGIMRNKLKGQNAPRELIDKIEQVADQALRLISDNYTR